MNGRFSSLDFEKRNKDIRNVLLKQKILNDDNTIRFSEYLLNPIMDMSFFDDPKIVLYHAFIHTYFSNNKNGDVENIQNIHDVIKKEMDSRGLGHFYIDKLDELY